MEQRTCEGCGDPNPRPRSPLCWRCKKHKENVAYRQFARTCTVCTSPFIATKADAHHCSVQCEATAKRRQPRFLAEPNTRDRAEYKRALKRDPCAYCGQAQCSGIDHILPTADGGPNQWENLTGCCHRCNGIKGTVPLLHALTWVPTSRQYHDQRRLLFASPPGG